ncbi:MAG: monofunctional biosynthetic peptidoglycan transglycosylase [Candidatus Nitricoxidivorans perseverans]|uniref:Biosynthetic peptidoglycan transglycosylase n=1 Tax=Candidatus Nitricoxidivorans perseverans TaxID=2975601 RepID=A0AA49IXN3_9PROT|nr:MAG: monofunctional biosynthetic peptidoglycan transglycosylase [Candidatus Nitricoxidivorans perseverans]
MRPAPRWLKRSLLALFSILFLWQGWYLGWVVWWRFADPGMTSFMSRRLDELREKNPKAELKRQWVPYGRISAHLKRAVIAAEDDKFVEHEGFDWEGIQKAMEKNQRRGKVVAGGSTISQQLAKNLFLSASKTPWRKAEEAVITLMIEVVWDKRRILEVYLNVVEWGEGLFGAEAAARRYFGVPAAALSQEQAARLAVMLPAPRRFGRNIHSDYLDRRTQLVLGRMQYSEVP